MYKLIIVDDEAEIRNGLCNYFPWGQLGFQIVAQFENGLQTLEYLKNNPSADCLLCDIKMPFMGGLELAKELSGHNSKIKIIFLSGHRDFEYAREALAYQVKDYILKPTKYEELIKVFSRLKTELDQSQAHNASPHLPADGGNYNEKIISVIKTYLQKNYPAATLEEAARLVHMNPYYLSKFFKDKTGENFSDYLLAVRMDKAAELLNDIAYKTYEISEMVGYSNPKNFTRTFKKYFGKTPKQFRNPS
jgi:two-component system response regulator YesN